MKKIIYVSVCLVFVCTTNVLHARPSHRDKGNDDLRLAADIVGLVNNALWLSTPPPQVVITQPVIVVPAPVVVAPAPVVVAPAPVVVAPAFVIKRYPYFVPVQRPIMLNHPPIPIVVHPNNVRRPVHRPTNSPPPRRH